MCSGAMLLCGSGSELAEYGAQAGEQVVHVSFCGLGGQVVDHAKAFHSVVEGLFTHAAGRGGIGHGILHENADDSFFQGIGVGFGVPGFATKKVEQGEGRLLLLQVGKGLGHGGGKAQGRAVLFEHALEAAPELGTRGNDEDVHGDVLTFRGAA